MLRHFADASAACDGVVSGQLDAVAAPLRRLAEAKDDGAMKADWVPWANDMRDLAARGAKATTLREAAQSVAALGTACGDCHRTTHGGPEHVSNPPYDPGSARGVVEKMKRHRYSVDALWLGMTGPVHQEWANGASALMNITVPGLVTHRGEPATSDRRASGEGELQGEADPRLPEQDRTPSASAGAVDLDQALRELRELGQEADRATIASAKQDIFARVIERCGACHARLGIRP